MCSMSFTVVVNALWNGVEMRPAICSGGSPVYCQTTLMMGMRISGNMSVGVRRAASGPMSTSSKAMTTKVYGFVRAIRTMPTICDFGFLLFGPTREGYSVGTQGKAFGSPQICRAFSAPIAICLLVRLRGEGV